MGVAVDSSGNVYVADQSNSRVEKFTNTGNYLAKFTGFNGPYGVAVDSVGNVYVADTFNHRIRKLTNTGSLILQWPCPSGACSFGSGPGEFHTPEGVAVDSGGNVYVLDSFNYRVELFGDSSLASIGLVAGWNLISVPIVPVNSAITKVLNDLIVDHNFTIVWSYQGGAWKSFTPPSSGTLTTMRDGFGYWIYVTQPSTLHVLGYVIPPAGSPPAYSLSVGWNLVGFKPQPDPTTPETVSVYLTSITGKYDASNVWIYTGSWVRATGSTSLTPGEAMWILVTTPATLRP